jgi:hypothetical protein
LLYLFNHLIQYKDYDPDGPGLERSFVEYCRIDSRQQQKAPNVYDPSSVVSARSINLEQQKVGILKGQLNSILRSTHHWAYDREEAGSEFDLIG